LETAKAKKKKLNRDQLLFVMILVFVFVMAYMMWGYLEKGGMDLYQKYEIQKTLLEIEHEVNEPPLFMKLIWSDQEEVEYIESQIKDPIALNKHKELTKKIREIEQIKPWFLVPDPLMLSILGYIVLSFISNLKSRNLSSNLLGQTKILPSEWILFFREKERFKKALSIMRYALLAIILLTLLLDVKPTIYWIYRTYPHHLFAPDVDAAIIATIGSTFTLGLTLIVTFYFNRQTQLAMIEQSRANLKERVIEHRMRIYPELEEILKKIGSLYPDGNRDDWFVTVLDFKELFQDNKYYFSKKLRQHLTDIYTFVMTAHKETLSPQQVEVADKKLDELIALCQAEIDKSLDLAALVDLD
jgi:hypothetical protein